MTSGNIWDIPQKTTINTSMRGKSIMVVGGSKTGKSTLCSEAPRPVFLMTENGGEGLVGFTPVPIDSWSKFKQKVRELEHPKAKEAFDTVVIDSYTNLILLLDKHIGQKLSTEKTTIDFGSDLDYGKGSKPMKNELTVQLQKLIDQGYCLMNIVHAEEKVDFETKKTVIGTSLSPAVYGVAEKTVDQIIYLTRKESKGGAIEFTTHFNIKGGFSGAGGRFVTNVDKCETGYAAVSKVLEDAFQNKAKTLGAVETTDSTPTVTMSVEYDFPALQAEFKELSEALVAQDKAASVKNIVEAELGVGRKASSLTISQAELLASIIAQLKTI